MKKLLNKTLQNILKNIPDHICWDADLLKEEKFYEKVGDSETYYLCIPFTITIKVHKEEIGKNSSEGLRNVVRFKLINAFQEMIDLYEGIKKTIERLKYVN